MCGVPIIVLFDKCKANLYTNTRAAGPIADSKGRAPPSRSIFRTAYVVACRRMCVCVFASVYLGVRHKHTMQIEAGQARCISKWCSPLVVCVSELANYIIISIK